MTTEEYNMSTVADDLLANLTHRCADEGSARKVVVELQNKLEQATKIHLDARSAVIKAEDEIRNRAIQNALMTEVGIVSEPVDRNGSSIGGLSIRVELPQPGGDEIQGLVENIVGAVCDAIVKRLQPDAEGAQKS